LQPLQNFRTLAFLCFGLRPNLTGCHVNSKNLPLPTRTIIFQYAFHLRGIEHGVNAISKQSYSVIYEKDTQKQCDTRRKPVSSSQRKNTFDIYSIVVLVLIFALGFGATEIHNRSGASETITAKRTSGKTILQPRKP
jgi:hypothetical protein